MSNLYAQAKKLEEDAQKIFDKFDHLTLKSNLKIALKSIGDRAEALYERHKADLGESPASAQRISRVANGATYRLNRIMGA